jgi:hypothetical protein
MSKMRFYSFGCVMALVIVLASTSLAGPFPAGWACVGACGTLGADGVVTLSPYGNPFYEYVSTSGGVSSAGEIASVGGTDGSMLSTPIFSANANDVLDFYFNFVTSDGAEYADYGWAELVDSSYNHVAWLFTGRTEPSGNIAPGSGLPGLDSILTPVTSAIISGGPAWSPLGSWSGACYAAGCGYTGWIDSQYTIAAPGNYILEFGVTNLLDQIYDTGLAIDGVKVAGTPIPVGTVPEPGTLLLLGSGLVGVVGMIRRRRS